MLGFLRVYGLLGPAWGPDGFYFFVGLPGNYLMLMSVLPTDSRMIPNLFLMLAAYMCMGALLCAGVVVLSALGISWDAPPARDCTPITGGCIATAAEWGAIGACGMTCVAVS